MPYIPPSVSIKAPDIVPQVQAHEKLVSDAMQQFRAKPLAARPSESDDTSSTTSGATKPSQWSVLSSNVQQLAQDAKLPAMQGRGLSQVPNLRAYILNARTGRKS